MTQVLELIRLSEPKLTLLKRRRLRDEVATKTGIQIVTFGRPVATTARCHYCGTAATTRDHVVARVSGGRDAWWNLVPSCASCNETKADATSLCLCDYCNRAVGLWMDGHNRHGSRSRRNGAAR